MMKRWILALALALALPASASAQDPVEHTRAAPHYRTTETVAVRVPTWAAASATQGTDGVVVSVAPGVGVTTIAASTFAPPPYPGRLRVNTVDLAGATASALTCTSCQITGYNSLGVLVTETATIVDESSEALTENSYERVIAFSCSGCANFAEVDAIKLDSTDHIAVDLPIGGVEDVLAVCFTEADDVSTNWICDPGSSCTVDQMSHSVDVGSCSSITLTDNATVRIRARASKRRVLMRAR